MWLSERAAAGNAGQGARAEVGTVTIGGTKSAVLLSGEYRNLDIVCPQGVVWRPGAGAQVLVIETGDGERYIAGAVGGGNSGGNAPEPAEGELCLRGGGTWLKLGTALEGKGTIRHTGDVYLTGRLFLNGQEVMGKGTAG